MRHDQIPRSLDDWINSFQKRIELLERAKRDLSGAGGGGGGGGGSVNSVTAGDSTITVGGTLADPTVSVNTIAESKVTNLAADLALKAPLTSPGLTGTPTAPTATAGANTTQLANTAFVQAAIALLIDSSPGALDTLNELAAALGDDPNFATTMTTALALKAPLSSPTFTGDPKAPTPSTIDNDTSLATTAFVKAVVASYALSTDLAPYAPLASPTFTGDPKAPTAGAGDSDTSVATTAFVQGEQRQRTAVFKVSGTLSIGGGATRLYNDTGTTWTITSVRTSVETAPSGGSVVVDVNKNGTTIFTTQANRPTITAGNLTSGKVTNANVTSVADGEYLTADVDTTTAPAAELSVQIVVR